MKKRDCHKIKPETVVKLREISAIGGKNVITLTRGVEFDIPKNGGLDFNSFIPSVTNKPMVFMVLTEDGKPAFVSHNEISPFPPDMDNISFCKKLKTLL